MNAITASKLDTRYVVSQFKNINNILVLYLRMVLNQVFVFRRLMVSLIHLNFI
nr:hypothetical protein CJLB15_00093 [Campylobacter phage CJLB-15]